MNRHVKTFSIIFVKRKVSLIKLITFDIYRKKMGIDSNEMYRFLDKNILLALLEINCIITAKMLARICQIFSLFLH